MERLENQTLHFRAAQTTCLSAGCPICWHQERAVSSCFAFGGVAVQSPLLQPWNEKLRRYRPYRTRMSRKLSVHFLGSANCSKYDSGVWGVSGWVGVRQCVHMYVYLQPHTYHIYTYIYTYISHILVHIHIHIHRHRHIHIHIHIRTSYVRLLRLILCPATILPRKSQPALL